MKTGGGRVEGQDGAADEAGNVVRIPRDWFGPTEDLVPFGPRASAPADQLDPNTFWDESSNHIQDVVEAPAKRQDDGWFRPGVPVRLHVPRGRGLAAIAAVAVIVAVAVAGWLLGNPRSHQSRSAVASVNTKRIQWPTRSLGRSTAPMKVRQGLQARTKPKPKPRVVDHRQNGGARTSASTATPVVYHTSQTSSSQPTYEAGNSSAAVSSGQSGRSSTDVGSTTPSAHRASQPSQPAFGANGALGPMSSPDG